MTGSLLALAGGACWGVGTVLAKMMFQRYTPNVLNLTTWQMLLGAVLAWPVTLAFPQQDIVWEPVLFWGVAYMARSEAHTSELQSLMRISYAVFCLKKKNPAWNAISQTITILSTTLTTQTGRQHSRKDNK